MTSKYNASAVDGNRTHFVQRDEPGYAWENAVSALLALPYLRAAWPMSSVREEEVWRASDVSGQNNHLSSGGVGTSAPEFARGTPLNHYVILDGSAWLSMTNYVVDPPWYEAVPGGLAAYDPYDAADYATSKVNLLNPGTYDADDSVPGQGIPDFVANGWDFTATLSQYLDTGIIPAAFDNTWSLLVWFEGSELVSQRPLLSAGDNDNTKFFDIWSSDFGNNRFYGMGNKHDHGADKDANGWMALTGRKGWFDGVLEVTLDAADVTTATGTSIRIGQEPTKGWYYDGVIKRVWIAHRVLTDAEVAIMYAAMTTAPTPPPAGGTSYVTVNAEPALPGSRRIVAGDGMDFTDGGGGSTLTVALDTPGTLSVTSANNAAAPHSHAITSNSNPGIGRSLLSTDANGYIQLVRIGLGVAPSHPLHVSGTSHLDGAVVVNESGADVDFRVEGSSDEALIATDGATNRVGIGWLVPDAKLHIEGTADEIQLVIDGDKSQSAHLQEWRDSAHNILAWVDKDGNIVVDRDNYGFFLGAGQDMDIYYDGTNGNIDTDLVAASDLTIDCGTAKTLVLEVPVYQDANVGSLVLQTGGTLPGIVEILDNTGTGTGVYTRGFDIGEQGSGSIEIPHDYKEGTDLIFHVHYVGQVAAGGGTDNIKWELTYTITRDGVTTPAATTDSVEVAYTTQYEWKRTDVETIVGTTLKIGDQVNFTIKRIAASSDDYSGELLVGTIGFHYQTDTMGSRQIGTK